MKRNVEVVSRRPADKNHEVVTVVSEPGRKFYHRATPCEQCPWRLDAEIGAFPAEAYRISANCSYDLSDYTFACHMSGKESPQVCAGFLLRGADHNLHVRFRASRGQYNPAAVKSDVELYDNYRAMAEANGVDPDDEALKRCR